MKTGKSLNKTKQDLLGNSKKVIVHLGKVAYSVHLMNLPTMFNFKGCMAKREITLGMKIYSAHFPKRNVLYVSRHIGQLINQISKII